MKLAVLVARWPIILLLVGIVNLSAITGPFLFDDFSNLDGLNSVNQGTKTALDFVLEGRSGPTGRPVSLVTFLWPAEDFPDQPLFFKLTNLVIHLLNTLLVFCIASVLLLSAGLDRSQAKVAGLVAMFIWGVHPINQSAIFLVIQRMTLLTTFFSLSAIYLFLRCRDDFKGQLKLRSIGIILAIGLLGVFSVFSKESGVVLPLYLLVIHATIFSTQKNSLTGSNGPTSRIMNWLVLYLPSLVVVLAFFYWGLVRTNPEFANRDFNMVERLLTEPRVIVDYLSQIFLPRLSGAGIFHDDYVISRSLLDPLSTVFSILAILVSLLFSIFMRKRWRVATFAILFYLVGHSIESTFLNLELYFEHRNYLPSVGLAIAAGYGAVKLGARYRPFLVIYGILVAFLGTVNANSWSSLDKIARTSAIENPSSVRAQIFLARYWTEVGAYGKAVKSIESAIYLQPQDGTTYIQLAAHKCLSDQTLGVDGLSRLNKGIKSARFFNLGLSDAAGLMVDMLKFEVCDGYSAKDLISSFNAVLNSGYITGRTTRYNLTYQMSRLYQLDKDFSGYMNALEKSYQIYPNLQIINLQLTTLFANGLYREAPIYILNGKELMNIGHESSIEIQRFIQLEQKYSKIIDTNKPKN